MSDRPEGWSPTTTTCCWKREIRTSLFESYEKLPSPTHDLPHDHLPIGEHRRRKGNYTDEDIEATRELRAEEEKKKRLHELHVSYIEKRWEALRDSWKKDEKDGKKRWRPEEEEHPGVYLVTQNVNDDYDTYSQFVVIARSKGEARATHPGGGNTLYKCDELERNEDWKNSGKPGEAPLWFLGGHDSWCHCAFVKVQRVSDYKPPAGEEPKFGIVTSSFRAG